MAAGITGKRGEVYYFTLGKPRACFVLKTKRCNRNFTFSDFYTIMLTLDGSRDCFTKYVIICTYNENEIKINE